MYLRCDDIFVDTNIEHCKRIWDLIGKYRFNQILGVVARGEGEPILRHKPARQGNKWILRNTGNKWFGKNQELVALIKEQLEKGDFLGLHGYYHISYRKEPFDTQKEHLEIGKCYLETLFNSKVKYFVPPFNGYNQDTEKAASSLGMEITHPTPGEPDVFVLNKNNTRRDIRRRARQDAGRKHFPFYHPFLLGGDWEGQQIYIERHNIYVDIPPPEWNIGWALRRFEGYLKELRKTVDEYEIR